MNGLIGKKLGLTQVFSEEGGLVPVTVVETGPCTVLQIKTKERDGYEALQLGFGRKKRANKPEAGHLKGKGPFLAIREFRVDELTGYEVGQQVNVGIFTPGDRVDVIGRSRGMGFQGGVKRYHFGGGPKTHGQSDRHRAPGSVGAGTTPGRVFRGLRMAGHMGDARVTTQNVKIVKVDAEKNLLLLHGAVPGATGAVVTIRHAKKAKKKTEAKKA